MIFSAWMKLSVGKFLIEYEFANNDHFPTISTSPLQIFQCVPGLRIFLALQIYSIMNKN